MCTCTGGYLRVLPSGTLCAGDRIDVVSRLRHDVSVAEAFRIFMFDRAELPRLRQAEALPAGIRADTISGTG